MDDLKCIREMQMQDGNAEFNQMLRETFNRHLARYTEGINCAIREERDRHP